MQERAKNDVFAFFWPKNEYVKMMVSDHVDDFEWLNILTIGHYFVGEIHGHVAMLQSVSQSVLNVS